MDTVIRVQIRDETTWILHNANTLGKGLNPTILSPAMNKMATETVLFSFGIATSLGERKFWTQTY